MIIVNNKDRNANLFQDSATPGNSEISSGKLKAKISPMVVRDFSSDKFHSTKNRLFYSCNETNYFARYCAEKGLEFSCSIIRDASHRTPTKINPK